MYKRNLFLIVFLCLAVFGGATYLAIGPDAPENAPPTIDELIRHLGDSDPDVRRSAESSLLALGEEAVPALERAAASKRRILASRSRRLLGKISVDSVSKAPPPSLSGKTVPDESEEVDGVELDLATAVDGQVYVRLVNQKAVPVLVARELDSGRIVCGYFGWFEFEDGKKIDVHSDVATIEWVVVAPGGSIELFVGALSGVDTSSRGRFVYDASEESQYRKLVKPSSLGAPLPPERFVSPWVDLTFPEN